MKRGLVFIAALFFSISTFAQEYELKSTSAIYHDLQELETGLRVLYVAAHPDDENTRLISWLENDQHVRTAYLSLTRGQGGQNLIGDEKGDGLGVIRTFELLEARKIDGGEQFFTRAVDFGYSKSAEESFEKWNRDEVMRDVVYVIRKYRPHVIITRFPPSRAAGHGHHEASAILAREAFDLAADATVFTEQLDLVQPWQTQALYHNQSSWWDKSLDSATVEALAAKKILRVDIGVFNEISGLGINEIASLARSKHRCQAFGTPRDRGTKYEYLELIRGEWTNNFLSNIDGLWVRSEGHQMALREAIQQFDFTDRMANFNLLQQQFLPKVSQRNMWAESADIQHVNETYSRLRQQLVGLRVEAFAGQDAIEAGSDYELIIECYNSSNQPLKVSIKYGGEKNLDFEIEANEKREFKQTVKAPEQLSNPYWLRMPHEALYVLENPEYLGLPFVNEHLIDVQFNSANMQPTRFQSPIHRKWNDRSYGEFTQPLLIVPQAHVNPSIKALIVPAEQSKTLDVKVKAYSDLEGFSWEVSPTSGWQVTMPEGQVNLKKGQEASFQFSFSPTTEAERSTINIALRKDDVVLNQGAVEIIYDHIPNQIIQSINNVDLIPITSAAVSGKLLYIEGSGDEVDDALSLIGYEVEKVSLSELNLEKMKAYKAVITGIRAFNRNPEVSTYHQLLMDYVKEGGNLIVQYNTTYDLSIDQIGPYPIKLSRERVTEENSEVNILNKKHPVFKTPNKIGDADWNNWVQERGLYFAGEWSDEYKPLIAWHDKGEDDVKGGLIVSEYGKGSFFYTGISFFRQLPAGVPGAYRLLVNMIEYQP